ncbi:MAG: peptide chain release factor N(5)-glutamine methyltransferase, partial [Clostridia bacterium]|nr:peptide chain release factor N(5)-glutamine methyltransferase [Clostridia bacterium]
SAFNKVLEMDADESIGEVKFTVKRPVKEVTEELVARFNGENIDSSDAEWIVSLTTGIKRSDLYGDGIVSASNIDKINNLVKERETGKPLQYVLGDTQFLDYKIKVDERVLIPRPETEELVIKACDLVDENSTVLDMCTGSGVIAIAIQKRVNCKVIAIDISADALELAKENATLNGAEIEFIESDLFSSTDISGVDLFVSNPPYIKKEDIDGLKVEVKNFEPKIALDGGIDGLDFYRVFKENIDKTVKKGGYALFECGIDQAKVIAEMFSDKYEVEILTDLEGVERFIKIKV